jgi:hypothetical protein
MLWITHRNPDGTVADCLSFQDLEDYDGWVETHPDFCDVNVEELALRARSTAACHEPADAWQVYSESDAGLLTLTGCWTGGQRESH